ncbi:MAG: hypothetical protein IPP15_07180 [Saprospiraceae bacterium]|uniref:Uncharacterized protein n=1 Tax=Candidatus Opimibacter skivensis TaxID=2982028 RepID=A0A9D7XPN3_9BACT|nr:hypothetical protein [Candidatus Opimibacter skivensis]
MVTSVTDNCDNNVSIASSQTVFGCGDFLKCGTNIIGHSYGWSGQYRLCENVGVVLFHLWADCS